MGETDFNEYSLMMNITIKNLEKRDFGEYTCASANALGKAEGTVKLQGKLVLVVDFTPINLSNEYNYFLIHFYGYRNHITTENYNDNDHDDYDHDNYHDRSTDDCKVAQEDRKRRQAVRQKGKQSHFVTGRHRSKISR